MNIYSETTTIRRECVAFVCCNCKRRIERDEGTEWYEALRWRDVAGYGSLWGDGTTYEINLCGTCSYGMFKNIATITGQE